MKSQHGPRPPVHATVKALPLRKQCSITFQLIMKDRPILIFPLLAATIAWSPSGTDKCTVYR